MNVKNLKICIRQFWKNKTVSFINLIGLIIGMCSFLLIFVWLSFETSFDNFHSNADNLYRISNKWPERNYQSYCPGPAAKVLKDDFPVIVNSSLFCEIDNFKVSAGENHFFTKISFVDPSFLQMFDFPLINGNYETVFDDPHSVVITEKLSEKLFGDTNPIGKSVLINDGEFNLKVSGILKNIPLNSHLQFELLIPAEIGYENMHSWNNNWPHIYVQLAPNAKAEEVDKQISNVVTKYRPEATNQFSLEALTRIHLYSKNGGGLIKYIIIFSTIALIILIIACFNFINLSTAQSMNRFKEFGIRKILGASRKSLMQMIFSETLLMSILAVFLAAILLEIVRPYFSHFLGLPLVINYDLNFLILILSICIFTALFAGIYPSIYFSSVEPISVLKKTISSKPRNIIIRSILSLFSIRSLLIVLQFVLSISFIAASIIILSQLNYMKNKDLGYKQDGILILPFQQSMAEELDGIKSELVANPNINNITFSFPHPVIQHTNSAIVLWDGMDPDNYLSSIYKMVDCDFFETFEIPIVKGTQFNKMTVSDKDRFIINEMLANQLGFENPIGQEFGLHVGGKSYVGTIVGVAKNYHNESLRSRISPLVFWLKDSYSTMSVNLSMQNFASTLKFIEETMLSFSPDFVFDYHFLEKDIAAQYKNEKQSSNLVLMATILAIILSALGLYGLVLFTIHQRKKEIGIRKVNGASVINIFNLLISKIIKWIIVSALIAIPLTYFIIEKWLENFAFRIALKPWMFVLAVLISMLISVLTVLYHSLKAAFENPVESLKYE